MHMKLCRRQTKLQAFLSMAAEETAPRAVRTEWMKDGWSNRLCKTFSWFPAGVSNDVKTVKRRNKNNKSHNNQSTKDHNRRSATNREDVEGLFRFVSVHNRRETPSTWPLDDE